MVWYLIRIFPFENFPDNNFAGKNFPGKNFPGTIFWGNIESIKVLASTPKHSLHFRTEGGLPTTAYHAINTNVDSKLTQPWMNF